MNKIWLMWLFIFAFILFNLGDVATTLAVRIKHDVFNESNPLYIIKIPLWALLSFKLALIGYLVYVSLRMYYRIDSQTFRFFFVYLMVLLCILNLGILINNYKIFKLDPSQVKPLSDEAKLQYYNEQIGNMKVVENITPYKSNNQIPLIFLLFGFNLIQFKIWQSFEAYRVIKMRQIA